MAKLTDEKFNFCNKIVILNVIKYLWLYVHETDPGCSSTLDSEKGEGAPEKAERGLQMPVSVAVSLLKVEAMSSIVAAARPHACTGVTEAAGGETCLVLSAFHHLIKQKLQIHF